MRTLLLLLALAPNTGLTQQFNPYPTAHISTGQWQSYFDEVSRKHASTQKESPLEPLVVFFDQAQKTLYAFTKPQHPAHPAVVNRRVVERANTVDVDQIGYFAGNEAAFAKLFQAFQQENVQMRERMRREAEGRK